MSIFSELSIFTGLAPADLERIIITAPARYKTYFIPKKSGGFRLIAHPSRELKVLQRYVLDHYLSHFPVHSCATAYAVGTSILKNASIHAKSRVIIKLDFERFFPSITVRDWTRYLGHQSHEFVDREFVRVSSKLLFWGEGSKVATNLSIGAPTSPMLSNILMYSIDCQIADLAELQGVNYSRYADDITISADSASKVEKFERAIRSIIRRSTSPKLTFNEKKRGIYGKGDRRMVTGLIITPTGGISIGRDRKRFISSMIYSYKIGILENNKIAELKGWLGFSISNEVSFIASMRKKYGSHIIDSILKFDLDLA